MKKTFLILWFGLAVSASAADYVLTTPSLTDVQVSPKLASSVVVGAGIPTMTGWGTNTTLWFQTNNIHYIWVNGDDYSSEGGLQVGTADDYTLTTPGNTGSFRVQGEVGANTLIVTNAAVLNGGLSVSGGGSPNSTFNGNVLADAYYSPTNANNTGSYVAGGSYFTNVTGNIILGPIASIPSGFWSTTVAVKNTSGTDRTVTMPAGVVDNASNLSPGVVFATNGFTVVFQISGFGSSFTNLFSPH